MGEAMKRKIMAVAMSGALVLGGLVAASPAHAATGTISVNVNGATCTYTATKVNSGVRASNTSCAQVAVAVEYVSGGGSRYWTPTKYSGSLVTAYAPSSTTYVGGRTSGSIVQGASEHFRTQTV